ncbi:GNAT family N-acetyltransferase [Psychrosphaera aquimarina]|uniref:GNAT family N-acetyltransferase n=1 Tax=Psychrosphaera aquimarina TaxID=2044854 RepID=A0ABU3R3E8_9GAMM|nr:GNAT family N-acetyltransferase [Psychrosphaera aquimarina]MDU0114191.1 GNAT family N-acetyltransferase [Psychrosphaera aquimarina]
MKTQFQLYNLSEEHFTDVINLGNLVHGDGYLFPDTLAAMHLKGIKDRLNSSFVLYHGDMLVGFRITYAPNNWQLDRWCTPELWPIATENVAYFKCNTIHPDFQGKGLGGKLLSESMTTLKQMGAKAGLSHIWMQSPGNASFKYFTKAGGVLIKTHPRRWHEDEALQDYVCIICGEDCFCNASEMMLEFDKE